MNTEKLSAFLSIADVPDMRKDLSKEENVMWLANNLGIRNSKIDGFQEAFKELKILWRTIK